jgi:hypothetical protein
MSKVKSYMPGGAHTSSNGFVNYFGRSPKPADVWADFPDAIIVNGSDNWNSHEAQRPQRLVKKFGIEILAWFHTGISGMTKSGFVCTPEEFAKFRRAYLAEYNCHPSENLRIHRRGEE